MLITVPVTYMYFLPSGEYHHAVTIMEEFERLRDSNLSIFSRVLQRFKGLWHSGGQMGMPGNIDEGFEGYCVISVDGYEPRLIKLEK